MSTNTKIDDGGPAFPMLVRCFDNDEREHHYSMEGGLSARDYFAGQALAGLCVHIKDVGATVVLAYRMADKMLLAKEATMEAAE